MIKFSIELLLQMHDIFIVYQFFCAIKMTNLRIFNKDIYFGSILNVQNSFQEKFILVDIRFIL